MSNVLEKFRPNIEYAEFLRDLAVCMANAYKKELIHRRSKYDSVSFIPIAEAAVAHILEKQKEEDSKNGR